jgi:hypothetical protein
MTTTPRQDQNSVVAVFGHGDGINRYVRPIVSHASFLCNRKRPSA